MPKINVLDSSVYNLIAAGEVVERPSSVIKELVENSIDAGATIITIEIEGGGTKSMSVTDNGGGIEECDLVKAFMPHATSKIKCGADLDAISTLGFRGEALASIGAVAQVALISRTKDSDIGGIIEVDGGVVKNVGQIGSSCGTTIKVKNLFYNIPARLKFLKKERAEEQEITALVSKFILANPFISFRYIADGKLIYQSTGAGYDDALYCVYDKDALTQTLKVSGERDGVEVHGYIGKASFSKPNRTYQTIVLNGRNISNSQIAMAVTNAYGEMLMKRQYPFFVLYINLAPDKVDVNVHPNKLEVRFENGNNIFPIVFGACSRALEGGAEIRTVDFGGAGQSSSQSDNAAKVQEFANINSGFLNTADIEVDASGCDTTENNPFSTVHNYDNSQQNSEYAQAKNQDRKQAIIDTISTYKAGDLGFSNGFGVGSNLLNQIISEEISNSNKNDVSQESFEIDNNEKKNEQNSKENYGVVTKTQQALEIDVDIKNVGKLFNTYLMIQDDENLYLIDQHAAHERILYEKFKAEIESGELTVQPMLAPYVLKVNAQESSIIDDNLQALSSLGFDISEFGLNAYKISAIPSIVADINFDRFFALFLQDNKKSNSAKPIDLIKDEVIQMSCKSAVKAGFDLAESEIKSLLAAMRKENLPLYCPHGRPIIVKVTKSEIEKWFKRIV